MPATASKTATQVRRILGDICKDLTGASLAVTTPRAFITGFIDGKTKTIAPRTLATYRSMARQFFEWLGDRADTDLTEVGKRTMVEFRDHVAPKL